LYLPKRGKETDQVETLLSIKSEELAAQRTAFIGRTIALICIVPLVTFLTPWPGPIITYGLLLVFVLLGWGSWHVASSHWGKNWHQYAFVSADFMLLTFTLLYPNPLVPLDYPPQFVLRFGSFIYFFVLLAGLAYVYQPKLVLWGGISAAVSWIVGVAWLLNFPDAVWRQSDEISFEAALADRAQPTFIDIGIRAQEIVVLLIAAGLLALAVQRSRTVALRQVRLAREREREFGSLFS
jgi:adenylate cyclase